MNDASPDARFVAPDLTWFDTAHPAVYADDVTIDGVCHRRLDPAYYAWLRHKLGLAKKALDAGRLEPVAFDCLRRRFDELHAWAVEHLGGPALAAAVKALDARTYRPPRPDDDLTPSRATSPPRPPGGSGHLFPARGAWPFTESIAADAVAKVDAIRDEALALGWTEAALYQNRSALAFPVGGEWGLVCFLAGDAVAGSVTREAITIRHARGAQTRFFNTAVEQPWRRPVLAGCA